MKCKTCPEELTMIKPDQFSMRICERCRTGCAVKKASGQTCFPTLTNKQASEQKGEGDE